MDPRREQNPRTESYFAWKEYRTVEGEEAPRLLVPWADPRVYESPMDWLFDSVEEAEAAKREFAPGEDWYLVKVTAEVVKRCPPEEPTAQSDTYVDPGRVARADVD